MLDIRIGQNVMMIKFLKMKPIISILTLSSEKTEYRLVAKRINEIINKGIIKGFIEKYLTVKMDRKNQYANVTHKKVLNIFTEIRENSIIHK